MPADSVIFIHIPKTAGRTLGEVLDRQYRPDGIFKIYGYGGGVAQAVEKLTDAPEAEKRRIELIRGHYRFGLHELLPQDSTYVTMLRDPFERAISHFHMVRQAPQHPLHLRACEMTLDEYVTSGVSREMDNGQTRLVSGLEKDVAFGACGAEMLERAKENVESRFSGVGIVEQFDASLVLMKTVLGWGDIRYLPRNVAARRSRRADFSETVQSAVAAQNLLDLELYRWAHHRLANWLAVPENATAVDAFRRENRRYGRRQELRARAVAGARRLVKKLSWPL